MKLLRRCAAMLAGAALLAAPATEDPARLKAKAFNAPRLAQIVIIQKSGARETGTLVRVDDEAVYLHPLDHPRRFPFSDMKEIRVKSTRTLFGPRVTAVGLAVAGGIVAVAVVLLH